MKTKLFCMALLAFCVVGPGAAAPDSVTLDANSADCDIFRVLNGSEAVPRECKDDSKSLFAKVEPPKPARLGNVNFKFNSDQLTEDSAATLVRIAKAMSDPVSHAQRYRVEGHTDAKGNPGYNLGLSQRRADSVRRFLEGQGVPERRLISEGYGARHLADPEHPYADANRRVEVTNARQGS